MKGPANRAFQGAELLSDRRLLGGSRQQLPVLRHDDRIDHMDHAICRHDISLLDVGPIDLHARRGYGGGKQSALLPRDSSVLP
jgi:hypothetical protein